VTEFNSAGYVALVLHGMACTALAGMLVPARRRWGTVLGLPAALIVTDWIRGRFPFGGLPIGGAALGQVASPLVPSARLGGTLLLTAMTGLAGAALAELVGAVASAVQRRPLRTGSVLRGAVAILVVMAVVLAGRLGPNGAGSGSRQTLQVGLVQGGGPRGLRGVYVDPQVVFDRQLQATAALKPPLDLVLWPEDVIQVDRPIGQTPEGRQMGVLAGQLGATVVAGIVEDVGTDRFRNAAVAWSPSGVLVSRYDKVHRVPFGEYVPGRSVFQHVANLSLIPRDAIPGRGPGLLDTPAGPLGVLISYEVFFEDQARDAVRAGGQVLLVPTNAASYSTSQVPTQEVAAARLRAWETGRDTVQAAPTGYSAVIDHNGRVLARSVLGRHQTLTATVQRRTGRTIFVRLGDLPYVIVGLVGLLAASWSGLWRLRQYRFRSSTS
jgi:apolipoprotein N-acyltransferase